VSEFRRFSRVQSKSSLFLVFVAEKAKTTFYLPSPFHRKIVTQIRKGVRKERRMEKETYAEDRGTQTEINQETEKDKKKD